jgi:4-amino-4-deoxy-L-arabinose transferase-like glycosyltransferase
MALNLTSFQARFLIIILMIVDLLVGIHQYNAHGIWLDEAYSYAFATASWPDLIHAVHVFDGPIVVWYVLLKLWFSIFHPTLFYGRLFSILCGVITLPAIYWLGYKMFNRQVGLLAAVLLLCNLSWWAREETVRMYALAIFLSVCSYIMFILATTKSNNQTRATVATIALNVLLSGLQILIGFNQLVSQFFGSFVNRKFTKNSWIILSTSFVGLLAFGYWFSHLGQNDTHWVPYIRLNYYSLKVISGTFAAAIGSKLIVGLIVIAGVIALRYSKSKNNVWMLITWIVMPFVVTIIISIFKPIIGERYILGCLPPAMILTAVGILSIPKKWGMISLCAVFLGAEAYGVYHMEKTQHEDWAEVMPIIVAEAKPGDVVNVYSRLNVVGFVEESKLEHSHLASGVVLYPTNATKQWTNADIIDHPFPSHYVTGKNSIYIVLAGHNIGHQTSNLYWPPTNGYDYLLKCSERGGGIMILRYAKNCRSNV